jgi:hypothetical protein
MKIWVCFNSKQEGIDGPKVLLGEERDIKKIKEHIDLDIRSTAFYLFIAKNLAPEKIDTACLYLFAEEKKASISIYDPRVSNPVDLDDFQYNPKGKPEKFIQKALKMISNFWKAERMAAYNASGGDLPVCSRLEMQYDQV